jgi:hypothetical protein
MAEPLDVHRIPVDQATGLDLEPLLVNAVNRGHRVDVNCMLYVVNHGRTTTITVPVWTGLEHVDSIRDTTVVIRGRHKRVPGKMIIGPFSPGVIHYGRYYAKLDVVAFRFEGMPKGAPPKKHPLRDAFNTPHCRHHLEFRSDCEECVSARQFDTRPMRLKPEAYERITGKPWKGPR